ncbi:MAG TPA: autotransporter domain-containing protein [Chitinophagales bacterium]|nr:autotransporter domain-containing protein [Chitinophagales bacterium]HRG29489.1 autotransporter domain-containing protein [Chitinophagales bacterium]
MKALFTLVILLISVQIFGQISFKGNFDLNSQTYSSYNNNTQIAVGIGIEKPIGYKVSAAFDIDLWLGGQTLLYIDGVFKYHFMEYANKLYTGFYAGYGILQEDAWYLNFGAEVGYDVPISENLVIQPHGRLGFNSINYGNPAYTTIIIASDAGLHYGIGISAIWLFE